jgi:hypothetical protein
MRSSRFPRPSSPGTSERVAPDDGRVDQLPELSDEILVRTFPAGMLTDAGGRALEEARRRWHSTRAVRIRFDPPVLEVGPVASASGKAFGPSEEVVIRFHTTECGTARLLCNHAIASESPPSDTSHTECSQLSASRSVPLLWSVSSRLQPAAPIRCSAITSSAGMSP